MAASIAYADTTALENSTRPCEHEASEEGDARMAWWREARFGMFIHWGPVSLTGHEIGWSRGKQTPIAGYDALYKRFNPEKFDADEWVETAKAAGMKYLVITTKHHDGFCLWPSALTDYDIGETPFRRDVLAELAAACQRHGIRFGTYYSVCDWHHPDFPLGSPGGSTEKPNPNLERYNEYLRGQVAELIERYGPLSTMWFDVPQAVTRKQAEATSAYVRKLQPDITINNRAGGGVPGDYDTPEQHIGGFSRQRPWETCMTICRQWAWKPNDQMKSLEECIQTLIRTAGGDGNLLFNVGPMPDGRIEARQVDRLKQMGEWLETYGNGIYGTRGGPFMPGKWGASTCKGSTVYLYIMHWTEPGTLRLPALDQRIRTCSILSGGDVSWNQSSDGISIVVGKEHQQDIATVVTLEVEGPAFDLTPMPVIIPSASLAFGKNATASNVHHGESRYGPKMALDDNPDTRWATDSGTRSAQLEVDLGKPATIDTVFIDERQWNRIRKFKLEYKTSDDWQVMLAGTTVGEDFRKQFTPVRAQHVRLNILEATESPTLWEFQLFKDKAGNAAGCTTKDDK
ncbi:MAG: hypothetical protein HN341_02135 [Verrucomicrobia bacterium]|nr:hypothetical protein [Verrucomicrobiota bacterium]